MEKLFRNLPYMLHAATHDSIGLGEDGPTHQPIETAEKLRATPNFAFWRPADGNETSATYYVANHIQQDCIRPLPLSPKLS